MQQNYMSGNSVQMGGQLGRQVGGRKKFGLYIRDRKMQEVGTGHWLGGVDMQPHSLTLI